MVSVAGWVRENAGVYMRNATAVRDYRVQLRGNRAVLLWALYLVILIGFGMFTYYEAAESSQMSVVEAQSRLQSFYHSIMYLLASMVALIAPALTATAVVSERQRRSLDLVFSAPVSPKYYLVGKMISSYRYIWMLLVLSLPVTAACVVLGGAAWSEVLATYALMSLHGLIYTAIALLFSTLAQKPVGAIVWSYVAVAFYCVLASYVSFGTMAASFSPFGRGQTSEMPFSIAISPFTIIYAAPSYMTIAGHQIPNWALMTLFTLLVTKLLLLGAASVLSPYGSAETKGLRIHSLVYMFLFSLGQAAVMGFGVSAMGTAGGISGTGIDSELVFSRFLVGVVLILVIFLPFMSCYGVDLEKKYWPDGLFSIKKILTGTPAGGLPYLLSLVGSAALGICGYALFANFQVVGGHFLGYTFYALALFFAAWSVGRVTSALSSGLRQARTLQFAVILLALALPLPFLTISDPAGFSTDQVSTWDVFILRPLFSTGDRTMLAVIYGAILIALGVGLTWWSEQIAKARYGLRGLAYGST